MFHWISELLLKYQIPLSYNKKWAVAPQLVVELNLSTTSIPSPSITCPQSLCYVCYLWHTLHNHPPSSLSHACGWILWSFPASAMASTNSGTNSPQEWCCTYGLSGSDKLFLMSVQLKSWSWVPIIMERKMGRAATKNVMQGLYLYRLP